MAFSMSHGDYEVREAKYAWREQSFTGFHKICLCSDEEPQNGQVYTMYHGTTLEAAEQIIAHGFTPSKGGILGKGVYVSSDEDKAASYSIEKNIRHQVIFELRVDVGKVKEIDDQGHPLQKTWHDHGYDTAWVPPNCGIVPSGQEDACIWDPNRIQMTHIVKAPKNSMNCLKNLLEHHHKKCLCGDEKPKNGQIYTMYHGTTLEVAEQIISQGFKQSNSGMLGKGVYVSRDEDKAASYPLEEKDRCRQVILELQVDVGKVKKIDYQGHPLQKSWHEHGYDTAWVPPNCGMVPSDREEDCVWEPDRIQVTRIVKAPKNSLLHLKNLLQHHHKKCLCGNEEPKNEEIYTMYHGTTLEAAVQISAHGFKPSKYGILGEGIYVFRDEMKAATYPKKQRDKVKQVILELQVDVGKVKKIDYQGHPLQKTWHKCGYDMAWVPPGCDIVKSKREQDCVWNPNRIQVIAVMKAPNDSLPQLKKLFEYYNRKNWLCGNEEPRNEHIYTMYHGTTLKAAEQIIAHGFTPSKGGMLGKGVYVSRDEEKAASYPLEEKDRRQQVILELRVNVGKVKKIDNQGHPLQKTWHDHGYDTAWVPPGCGMVDSDREEDCVWDPSRIQVIDVVKAPKNYLCHLQNLINQHDPSFHSIALTNKKGIKRNFHIMYHVTSLIEAEEIISQGFKCSPQGVLGKGVYVTRYANKAIYDLLDDDDGDDDEKAYQVMLRLRVNVGNVIVMDSKSHPLMDTRPKIYDTAWLAPASGILESGLGDFCVRDPGRVNVIGIEKAPEDSLAHLQKLVKQNALYLCINCRRRSKRAKKKNICIIDHCTTMEAAEQIIRNGFQSSPGVVGKGVYLCKYTENTALFPQDNRLCEVILELWVDIGKDIQIDYQGHQLQKTWQKEYDTVFMPGGCAIVSSGLDEYCVKNPSKIKLVDIIKAPGNAKVDLQNLAEAHVQGFCLKCVKKANKAMLFN